MVKKWFLYYHKGLNMMFSIKTELFQWKQPLINDNQNNSNLN